MRRLAPVPLVQVMIFKDADNLRNFGRAVWSALAETAAFYRRANLVRSCERFVFDNGRPTGPLRQELPLVAEEVGVNRESDVWTSLQTSHPRIYSQERVAGMVRRILGGDRADTRVLICTDQQIEPPEDWRYILWDSVNFDVVISTAPMDPLYWGIGRNRRSSEAVRERAAYVKQRARAAMLSGTGTQIGLERCDNPACFLYRDVDSVLRLDSMAILGKEHGQDDLTDYGFAWTDEDPDGEQTIAFRPVAPPEAGRYA